MGNLSLGVSWALYRLHLLSLILESSQPDSRERISFCLALIVTGRLNEILKHDYSFKIFLFQTEVFRRRDFTFAFFTSVLSELSYI